MAEAQSDEEEKKAEEQAESELETDMTDAPESMQPTEAEGADPQEDPV